MSPEIASRKDKGRKFFQQMEPTFAIELQQSTATNLEFLDNSDPEKDIVVRKKAREWVNKNKALSKQSRDSSNSPSTKASKQAYNDVKRGKRGHVLKDFKVEDLSKFLLQPITNSFDPFGLLPQIGRRYDHIIQFFLTNCPEEVPCSDDKYLGESKHKMITFSVDNTVLGNMMQSKATFMLWLYATVTIRDRMSGRAETEEAQWYYSKALRAIREHLKRDELAGNYSDTVLKMVACITATASFAGMSRAAELHRNAMIRLLDIRGKGDILKGLESLNPWTAKAMQWCEIIVTAELVETPVIPYCLPLQSAPPPPKLVSDTARLTKKSLANLPPLTEPLKKIVGLCQHIGLAYAQTDPEPRIDLYVLQTLYDAEYRILRLLEDQKNYSHNYPSPEILLAEAFQLYFWTGPRMLPPRVRLCEQFLSRIMRALRPLLFEEVVEIDIEHVQGPAVSVLDSRTKGLPRTLHHPRVTNNAIAWTLALCTKVTLGPKRPEHFWFKAHFRNYLQLMAMDTDEQAYLDLLETFPPTEGFSHIDLRTIHRQVLD